jgi:hypothetical protein
MTEDSHPRTDRTAWQEGTDHSPGGGVAGIAFAALLGTSIVLL